MKTDVPMEADYVIVGGGLCGCTIASRIKQSNPSATVLVLEAGPNPSSQRDTVTPMGGFTLAGTELDWAYQTAPTPTTANRIHTLTAGKTLGGGTMLNYGGWSRGERRDYDEWAARLGDQKWSYDGLLPYFKRSERFHDVNADKTQHGFHGPTKVTSVRESDPKRRYPLCRDVEAAWREVGLTTLHDSCSGKLYGLSEFLENWVDGKRQPANLAYSMSSVKTVTSCAVERVVLSQDNTAKGVVLADGRTVNARKEVVLCAGTFATPLILLRSGVGPSTEMSQFGIPAKLDSPAVGSNYGDHYAVYQLWKIKNPERGLALGSSKLADPAFVKGLPTDWVANEAPPREMMEKALDADGVYGQQRESILQEGRTFIETLVLYVSMAPGVPVDGTYISTSIMLTVPTSRGRVSFDSSSGGLHKPLIEPNFFQTAFDRLCLTWGVRRLLEVMLTTSAMEPYIEAEVPPPGMSALTPASSDQEIEDRIRSTGMPHFHASGSCAMGEVTDTNLKVKGMAGLRICDASVLPTPIGGHPMATLYGIAEQAADLITSQA